MKTYSLLFLVCCTLFSNAQDHPYCPCQEEARLEKELQSTFQNAYETVFVIVQPQQRKPQVLPVSLPSNSEGMMRINVKPEKEEVTEQQLSDTPPIEVQMNNVPTDLHQNTIAPQQELTTSNSSGLSHRSNNAMRTKQKVKKKMLHKRLKKQKKRKKYRGKCPRF